MGKDREKFERTNRTRGAVSPRPARFVSPLHIIAKAIIILVTLAVIFVAVYAVIVVLGKNSINKKAADIYIELDDKLIDLEAQAPFSKDAPVKQDAELLYENVTYIYNSSLISILFVSMDNPDQFNGDFSNADAVCLVILDPINKETRMIPVDTGAFEFLDWLPADGYVVVNKQLAGFNSLEAFVKYILKKDKPTAILELLKLLNLKNKTDLKFGEMMYLLQETVRFKFNTSYDYRLQKVVSSGEDHTQYQQFYELLIEVYYNEK